MADNGKLGTGVFPGFQKPNYTMVPDELFDDLLVELSGAELKVLLYIIRRTFGFKRESDCISLNQMLTGIRTRDGRILDRGTGLAKSTLVSALKGLVEKNVIIAEKRSSAEQGFETTNYALNILNPSTKIELGWFENRTTASTKNELPMYDKNTSPSSINKRTLVRKPNLQETVKQNKEKNQSISTIFQEIGLSKAEAYKLSVAYPEPYLRAKIAAWQQLSISNQGALTREHLISLCRMIETDYSLEQDKSTDNKKFEDNQLQVPEEKGTSLSDNAQERELWYEAQRALQMSMMSSTYATYLQKAELINLEGGVATLGVPNEQVRDWVQNRLAGTICRVLAGIVGQSITLAVVVSNTGRRFPSEAA